MDTMLWVCGGIALASAILALIFLPRRSEGIPAPESPAPESPAPESTVPAAAGASDSERAQLEV
jgi:hypothetical protein